MKKIILSVAMIAVIFTACNNKTAENNDGDSTMMMSDDDMIEVEKPIVKSGKYVNLADGQTVYIIADPTTGVAIDSVTKATIEFYYDPITLDTIYQNGYVVNSMLIKEKDGKYKLDGMKIKIDGDKIKIKTDSSKMKMDGEDMKMKTDDGDTTIKVKN
ncbi:hypothetical protein [Pedobacter cryophilus]|uniref:Copper resistance protein NlpE n=1 Tax=Pedobacter cryophilus TaxID=2571271 RepID=A0A4V5NXF1_9SPHI|nr:hypothetical protein [Pedobacter cryophilus]TKB98933.1 hypothetical protein FA046_07405 [Pedobacter cryophilus]